jgi:hypothetical protein
MPTYAAGKRVRSFDSRPAPVPFLAFHLPIRAILCSIVEFDLKFLPVPVTAYSQASTLRSR